MIRAVQINGNNMNGVKRNLEQMIRDAQVNKHSHNTRLVTMYY